jgi:voltage-gated potassium channel
MELNKRAELLSRFERASELPLMALALAIVPLFLIPFFFNFGSTADNAFMAVDWTIWAVFAVDLTIRVYLAEHRPRYLRSHWYDVLIVALPFLRPLRVVRSARALRLARMGPYLLHATHDLRHLLRERGLQYVLAFGVAGMFLAAALMFLAERGHGGTINGYDTALWWAISTMTTVGYGDVYPVTAEGKAIAVFLMLLGIAFLSWLTANIAAFLVQYSDKPGHTVTNADLLRKLESLESEIQELKLARTV